MAGGQRSRVIRIERRLEQPRWLVGRGAGRLARASPSLLAALVLRRDRPRPAAHVPPALRRRLPRERRALRRRSSRRRRSPSPGSAAAAAFRMQLFNIGGEGQLYFGAIAAAAAGHRARRAADASLVIAAMCVAGLRGRRGLGADPGRAAGVLHDQRDHHLADAQLRRGAVLNYLIFDSASYWRDTSSPEAKVFPQGKTLPDVGDLAGAARRRARRSRSASCSRSSIAALALGALHADALRLRGAGDRRLAAGGALRRACARGGRSSPSCASPARSPASAARARTATSGTCSTRAGCTQPATATPGSSSRRSRATTRSRVVLVAFLLGGLQNAGYTLQGADFPSGLVGVMQGLILFCALGGELLDPLPPPLRRGRPAPAAGEAPREQLASLVVVAASAVVYGTPLLYAALGELLAERSGVLNLGVEGMMLVGAVMGFWAVQRIHAARARRSPRRRVAALAGALMALIHAFLVVTLRANQIVSGLALTIFAGAAGLSSYLGNDLNLADSPAQHAFDAVLAVRLQRPAGGRADRLRPDRARLRLLGLRDRRRALPLAHAARAERARGRRVARRRPTRWGSTSRATATRTRSSAARSRASAAPASPSRSRRSGWTGSPPARAGSRSRSSSSPSGGRSSASSARTSSARSRRCRSRSRRGASRIAPGALPGAART